MAKSDRLFRLLHLLRSLPPPVTAARLAAEAEVSLRTLYRDIDSLRAGGALIDGAAGYGYRLTEDPALPPQMFTRTEIEALVLGLAGVRASADPELAGAAESALARISATLPGRVQRQLAHAVMQVHRYRIPAPLKVDTAVLRQACWDERALDLTYVDAAGTPSHRRVWPLSVVHLEETRMLLAFCCLRQAFRQFRLDRIESALPAGESFRPQRAALLRQYIAQLKHAHG